MGHFGVGKSSLIRRFVENTFSENYKVTIGVHIFKKDVQLDENKDITLIIWDLEGNDFIENTRPSYLIGTNGFIYVFDLTRPSTFEKLEEEINYIKHRFPKEPLLIVGNKKDLVTNEFIKENKTKFKPRVDFFTSAKTGIKVEDLFTKLANELTKLK